MRVRVKGEFPRAGSMQFISSEVALAAARRTVDASRFDEFVIGVDIARFGGDSTVIAFRRGRDAKSHGMIKLRGVDLMTQAARIADEYMRHRPDQLFVDEGGPGGGVVDRLRQLQIPVVGVQFGGKSNRSSVGQDAATFNYANKRAEMWGRMREWLEGGAIPDDQELIADLTGVEYGYKLVEGKDATILESKDDMRRRGLASPDLGDALALCFAYPVGQSRHTLNFNRNADGKHEYAYDSLGIEPMQLPSPHSF